MQKIQCIGFLGNDAEVKDLTNNQVINFSVAVSESYTNKQGEKVTNTVWFECAKWGNNTAVAQYLKKGTQVYVEGKVSNRAWLKEDGTAQVVNGINVFEIQLLGSKDSNSATSPNTQTNPKEYPQSSTTNSFVDGEDPDSLPF